MGLIMLQLAKRTDATSVEVVDVNPERLSTAKLLGCTAAAASADQLDRPQGWEIVVDATGNEAAIQDGIGRVRPGGTFLQVGVTRPTARLTSLSYPIAHKEI